MSTGGNLKSSKLFAMLYLRFVLKNKFSLRTNSESFSNKKAPLKNSSLEAKNGLNLAVVFVLNTLAVSLSYITFALLLNDSSISVTADKLAILISFFILLLIPASLPDSLIICSTNAISEWTNCVNSNPSDREVSVILFTPIPFSSKFLINWVYLLSPTLVFAFWYS